MNVLDIRPHCNVPCSCDISDYASLRAGTLTPAQAGRLLPDRMILATVWRYLSSRGCTVNETPTCLCRKIVRRSGNSVSLGQLMVCLDIFRDVGLIRSQRLHKCISIELNQSSGKADLNQSKTMQLLQHAKES
jgi:hypothetical protein